MLDSISVLREYKKYLYFVIKWARISILREYKKNLDVFLKNGPELLFSGEFKKFLEISISWQKYNFFIDSCF